MPQFAASDNQMGFTNKHGCVSQVTTVIFGAWCWLISNTEFSQWLNNMERSTLAFNNTLNFVTSLPTASMTPAPSFPGVYGSGGVSGWLPERMYVSTGLTPADFTRISNYSTNK